MNATTRAVITFVALTTVGCCRQTYAVQHVDTNATTLANLDQGILLFYQGEQTPEVVKTLGQGTQRGRSGTCEEASIKVLKKMQEDAKKIGANAIINLVATWKRGHLSSEDGTIFKCEFGLACHLFGIQWTGDFVVIGKPAAAAASDAAAPEPTTPPAN